MSCVAVTAVVSLSWTNMEAVNKQDIVSVCPSGYHMNKSTHPVDLNVCDLTPLSLLPPLLPLERTVHNGSVDTHTPVNRLCVWMCVCVRCSLDGGVGWLFLSSTPVECTHSVFLFSFWARIQSPDLDTGGAGTHVVLNNPGPPSTSQIHTHTHTV